MGRMTWENFAEDMYDKTLEDGSAVRLRDSMRLELVTLDLNLWRLVISIGWGVPNRERLDTVRTAFGVPASAVEKIDPWQRVVIEWEHDTQ